MDTLFLVANQTFLFLFSLLVGMSHVSSLTVVLSEWWCAAMAPICCLSSGDRLRGVGLVAEDFV